jgi:hypothetical protein
MSAGHALVKLLLAPDKDGNVAALARRMGVQGLIFNCKSWFGNGDGEMGNYSYCYTDKGKRKKHLDPTQAHMNHVHIELNLRGAAKKTTFWNRSVRYPVENEQPTPQPLPPTPVQTPTQAPAQTPVQTTPNTFTGSGGSTDGTSQHHHHWNGGGTSYQDPGQ